MPTDCEVDRTPAGSDSVPILRCAAVNLLLLAVLYPISLGPVCWTMARLKCGRTHPRVASFVSDAYMPLAPWVIYGPPFIQTPMRWWIGAGMASPTVYHSAPDGIVWSNPGYSYTLWHY